MTPIAIHPATSEVLPRSRRAAKDSPPAESDPQPVGRTPGANTTSPPARDDSTPRRVARAGINASTQANHRPPSDPDPPGSNETSSLTTHDVRIAFAGGGPPGVPPTPTEKGSMTDHGTSGWAELRLYTEIFDDLQRARIRFENQIRSATVDPDFAAGHLERLAKSEREAAKILKRTLKHAAPHLYAWAQETRGVGEHTLARLLGATGDPRTAQPHHWQGEGAERVLVADEPYARNVAKLWAYCGVGDPERRRRKGMTAADGAALGNPRAKVAIHLMAEAQVKSRGFYRDVYDQARIKYAAREGWSLGHQHNAALRKVKKELLKAIWRAA